MQAYITGLHGGIVSETFLTALLEYINALTALLGCFDHFSKGSNNVTKKYCAVKSTCDIHMMTFITHFPLIVPVPTFCSLFF